MMSFLSFKYILDKQGLIFKKNLRVKIWIFSIFFIILCVFLFGWPLGMFGGQTEFHYGDDSPAHIGLINFIVKNWPHINWYPDWCGGAIIQRYNPLAYLICASFSVIMDCLAGTTIFFFAFISISFTAVGVYGLVYEITGNRVSAFIANSCNQSSFVTAKWSGMVSYAEKKD